MEVYGMSSRCYRCTFACPSHRYGVMAHSAPSCGGDSGVIEEAPLHGDDRTRVVCCPSSFVHFNTSSTSTHHHSHHVFRSPTSTRTAPGCLRCVLRTSLYSARKAQSQSSHLCSLETSPTDRFMTARVSPVRLIFCSAFCRPPRSCCRSIYT